MVPAAKDGKWTEAYQTAFKGSAANACRNAETVLNEKHRLFLVCGEFFGNEDTSPWAVPPSHSKDGCRFHGALSFALNLGQGSADFVLAQDGRSPATRRLIEDTMCTLSNSSAISEAFLCILIHARVLLWHIIM